MIDGERPYAELIDYGEFVHIRTYWLGECVSTWWGRVSAWPWPYPTGDHV